MKFTLLAEKGVIYQSKNTVKLVQTTTSLKRPLAVNDHFISPKAIPLIIFPVLNDHLLDATNDHQILFLTGNGPSFNGHLDA